jgi:hypothetical protein
MAIVITNSGCRSVEQHIDDFIQLAKASRDSMVAMQAVLLANRLKEVAREKAANIDTTNMVPVGPEWGMQ